jgi:hypothetical protein
VAGVLSALPIIYVGNACCCLWIVGGGILAAYLLQQNQSAPITPGDGALVGLLAGIIGAFVTFLVSIPIDIVTAPFERQMMSRIMDMAGNMPPDLREVLENARNQQEGAGMVGLMIRRILGLMLSLVVGSTFSTIGGLLGAVLFAKRLPPGVIDVPPGS